LRFSVVIATLNNQETINKTIFSVKNQKFKNYEIIIVDGGSEDQTLKIINNHALENIKLIYQKKRGIYNAFNLGIEQSIGEIIIFLNADDFFINGEVLDLINNAFIENKNLEVIISNVKIVNNHEKPIRDYKCNSFNNFMFYFGHMPPHPGIFIKKSIYSKFGKFLEEFENAGDFEFIVRLFLKHKVLYKRIDKYFVTMLAGGKSNKNIKSFIVNTIEIKKALKINRLFSSYILITLRFVIKLFQFIK